MPCRQGPKDFPNAADGKMLIKRKPSDDEVNLVLREQFS